MTGKAMFVAAIVIVSVGTRTVHAAATNIVIGKSVNATNLAPDRTATMLSSDRKAIFPFAIHNVTFSPDGKLLASGEGFGHVRLWDVETGQLHKTVKAHQDWGFSVAWLAGGKRFITGGGDDLIHLFDTENGHRIETFAGHSNDVHAIVVNSAGTMMMSAGDDKTIIFLEH